jgi:hypothetical protein
MHCLPVVQKAWVGSICIHNQGRCVLLSPGNGVFAVYKKTCRGFNLEGEK